MGKWGRRAGRGRKGDNAPTFAFVSNSILLLRNNLRLLNKISIVGLNGWPPKRYVHVLITGTCECDLICKESLCRCD